MVKVGVIGLGMMGSTHLDAYVQNPDAKVVAVADKLDGRRTGKENVSGNIQGQAQGGFDFASVNQYDEGMKLIDDPEVELVDVCLVTPLHIEYATAALEAGKHVLVEKPVCRTYAQAKQLAETAAKAKGFSMAGQCMRFWPGWTWLKQAIDDKRYGSIKSAFFRRLAPHPGGRFYSDGEACGGALLDLHLHDSDFVQFCFGLPKRVSSRGYSKVTDQVDHVVTHYHYDDVPLVVAEGGWSFATDAGFSFQMSFMANFDNATAEFDLGGGDRPVTVYEPGKQPSRPEIEPGMGYAHELNYLIKCINDGTPPERSSIASAAKTVAICEAEMLSVSEGGAPVEVKA